MKKLLKRYIKRKVYVNHQNWTNGYAFSMSSVMLITGYVILFLSPSLKEVDTICTTVHPWRFNSDVTLSGLKE